MTAGAAGIRFVIKSRASSCTTLIAYLSAVSRSALTTETHQVYSSAPLWLSPSRTVAPSWTYTPICITTNRSHTPSNGSYIRG